MSEHNHHRGTHRKLSESVHTVNGKPWGHPDKAMQNWTRKSELADVSVSAGIGNDFTIGHRGMARSARGAKKFVTSRIRRYEAAATKEAARHAFDDVDMPDGTLH